MYSTVITRNYTYSLGGRAEWSAWIRPLLLAWGGSILCALILKVGHPYSNSNAHAQTGMAKITSRPEEECTT